VFQSVPSTGKRFRDARAVACQLESKSGRAIWADSLSFEPFLVKEHFRDLSVPTVNLYSAAEIAAMRLPGLPTTKARIIERAAAEGWHWEERTGLGGKRKVYLLPDRYTPHDPAVASQTTTGDLLDKASEYVATKRAAGEMDDGELIREVVLGVERWLERNKLHPEPERKAALIALLFKYFKEDRSIDEAKLDTLLRAVA
jgi:hypothetical protein